MPRISIPNMTSTIQIHSFHISTQPAAWSYEDHQHTLYEIIYCLYGEITEGISGVPVKFRKGDWLLLKSGVMHNTHNHSDEPFTYVSILFDIDDLELRKNLKLLQFSHIQRQLAESTKLPDYMEDMLELIYPEWSSAPVTITPIIVAAPNSVERLFMQANLLLIIGELIRNFKQQDAEAGNDVSALDLETAHRIEGLLKEGLYSHATISAIAQQLGLNRSHLSRVFSRVFGTSPRQYLTIMKVNKAKELLATSNITVEAVSEALGFQSVQHFSRQFRRWTGVSPNQFRPRHRAVSLGSN